MPKLKNLGGAHSNAARRRLPAAPSDLPKSIYIKELYWYDSFHHKFTAKTQVEKETFDFNTCCFLLFCFFFTKIIHNTYGGAIRLRNTWMFPYLVQADKNLVVSTLPVKMFGPFWSVWCKMALAEVGGLLP